MKTPHIIAVILGILIFVSGYAYLHNVAITSEKVATQTNQTVGKAKGFPYDFTCKDNKSITATFYPSDDIQVDLVLSDGRTLVLPHATSASGARYANADESIVFWNKGNTAFITENDKQTYSECVTTTTYPELSQPQAQATSTLSQPKITQADNSTTIHYKRGDRFAVSLGELNWSLAISNPNIISRVRNLMLMRGVQGVYTADNIGTTTISATGRPFCKEGTMCAQYMINFIVTIVVDR